MKRVLLTLLACLLPALSWAQETVSTFGDYQVHYNVFNSSFIQPDIAEVYGITRAGDQALINIALTRATAGGSTYGLPATVTGVARNLMQQQTPLTFKEISEPDATYYIAALRFTNEDILHFDIEVTVDGQPPFKLTFSRKLYVD